MNITLFGGSFNPPTIGHQIVITQAFELIPNIEQLWLLPDYQHSFAKNETLAPAADRLAMAQMLINKKVKLETGCIDKKMSGNTIEHIAYLKTKYNRHRFSFLMGSDNLRTFTRWPEWQNLLHLMTFYIYPRAGFPLEPLYTNMMTLSHPQQIITNISSTLVRERIKQNLDWGQLVPPAVAEYIRQKPLFLTDAYTSNTAVTAV